MVRRKRDLGETQHQAVCEYLGLGIETPNVVSENIGFSIPITLLPQPLNLTPHRISIYEERKLKNVK